MPLMQGKSKRSFDHNVKTEVNSGKPQRQALAISYAIKRRNEMKRMPEGDEGEPSPGAIDNDNYASSYNSKEQLLKKVMERRRMAEGGMVERDDLRELDKDKAAEFEHGATESGYQPKRWIENIREGLGLDKKKQVSQYAEGGMVEGEMPENDSDQILDQDDFLSQDSYEDPEMKRKHLVSSLMKDMHRKHFGRY